MFLILIFFEKKQKKMKLPKENRADESLEISETQQKINKISKNPSLLF